MEDRAIEEIKRHFDVVAESLKDEIKLIAEGHILLNKKIDDLGEGVDDLRKENAEEHALLRFLCGDHLHLLRDRLFFCSEGYVLQLLA